MDIVGLGVDICEIARMERAISRHRTLRDRVFTPEEIAYCDSKARPAESYAGRFAAREATIKALGGYRGRRWQDISVTRHPSGAPAVRLDGNAKRRADALGVTDVLITFTHEKTSAVAFAIARPMKPVLTPAEASTLDRETQERGVGADALMERAGRAVARAARDLAGGSYGRRAVIVCGKGNNGGDGLVAARHLGRWGVRTTVVLLEDPSELREPAATNARRLEEAPGIRLRTFHQGSLQRELARADVAVDAIFGTGFRGMPEDDWAGAIASLNKAGVPVVAVDIPSGVNGTTGVVEGEAVRARLTVTFGAVKLGAVLMPGAEHAGHPPRGRHRLPRRSRACPRVADGAFGRGFVVAGARSGYTQARVGCAPRRRIVARHDRRGPPDRTCGGPGRNRAHHRGGSRGGDAADPGRPDRAHVPSLAGDGRGTVAAEAVAPLLERLEAADALAIGPGLTTNAQTVAFIREAVRRSPVPLVLDADGLNAFTGDGAALQDREADAVLTPHVGEFARVTGVKARDLDADRPAHVRALAEQTGAITLLKGSRTVIAQPGGRLFVNVTGSPALATAGTGDVLTGMIGGLLARGVSPLESAAAAAYLHGLAGVFAGRDLAEGVLAGDVLERIPEAFSQVEGR